MTRCFRLTVGQTMTIYRQGIPDAAEKGEERKLDTALEHETDPRILALLREGVLTAEPPDAGEQPSARGGHHKPARTMRDMVRARGRRHRARVG